MGDIIGGPDWTSEADQYMREGFMEGEREGIKNEASAERDAEWVAALLEIEKESEALWLDDPSNEIRPSQAWSQSLEWLLTRMTGLGLYSEELKARMTGAESKLT